MAKTKLKELLKKVKTAKDVEKLKPEIKETLSKLKPAELALAEQELMAEGISPEEIRKLCGPHLELLREALEGKAPALDPMHPIRILREEHEVILQKLGELNQVVEKANAAENFSQVKGDLERLEDIAHHLIDAESHHKREEEALFPELEKNGVTGPPMVMRMEHTELRQQKAALKELVRNHKGMSYNEFASKLDDIGGYIVRNLNDHIYKENNILYPTALQVLEDETWHTMKEKFDEIGYCCFTPGLGAEHTHD